MWMAAANFRRNHSPSQLTWSQGWRQAGAQSAAFTRTLAMTGHDDSTINIAVAHYYYYTFINRCSRHRKAYIPKTQCRFAV